MSVESKSILGWGAVAVVAVVGIAVGYGLGQRGGGPPAVGAPAPPEAAAPGVTATAEPIAAEAVPSEPRSRPAVARSEPARPAQPVAPAARQATAGQRTAPAAAAFEPPEESESEAAATESIAPIEPDLAAPDAPAPAIEAVELPAGTPLRIRLAGAVSSSTAVAGDAISGELSEAVALRGRPVLPAGTRVRGRVVEAQGLKRIGGQASLALSFDRLVADLETVAIRADWARTGKSETGKDAATIAAGAAAGAVLGNQAKKRDRGKILGALIGAAAGAAVASKTPGEEIELPAGTVLEVELTGSVEVTIEVDEPGG